MSEIIIWNWRNALSHGQLRFQLARTLKPLNRNVYDTYTTNMGICHLYSYPSHAERQSFYGPPSLRRPENPLRTVLTTSSAAPSSTPGTAELYRSLRNSILLRSNSFCPHLKWFPRFKETHSLHHKSRSTTRLSLIGPVFSLKPPLWTLARRTAAALQKFASMMVRWLLFAFRIADGVSQAIQKSELTPFYAT